MESVNSNFYNQSYYAQRHTRIDPYLEYIFSNYIIPSNTQGCLLEVGCGSGAYINYMRDKGQKIWGIDFSFEAAKISGQINASALSLPFSNNSFDVILSIHMIEHLNTVERDIFLAECRRVLKNKGVLFIVTPNGMSPGRFILGKKWFPDPSHINIENPFRLSGALKKNGFIKVKSMFFLHLGEVNRTESDIVKYYGLDCVFKRIPFLQDLLFFLMFSTPLSFMRDVIYMRGELVK